MKTCKKCGGVDFDTQGRCVPCTRKYNQEWAALNVDKRKKQRSEHRAENKERLNAKTSEWRSGNADAIKNYSKQWREKNDAHIKQYRLSYSEKNAESVARRGVLWRSANKGLRRVYEQNRRSRKRQSGGELSPGLIEKLLLLQKGKCPCCGLPLGRNFHLDHKMPLALGGRNEDANMQLLRQKCNNQKGAIHPVVFMQSRGFLL